MPEEENLFEESIEWTNEEKTEGIYKSKQRNNVLSSEKSGEIVGFVETISSAKCNRRELENNIEHREITINKLKNKIAMHENEIKNNLHALKKIGMPPKKTEELKRIEKKIKAINLLNAIEKKMAEKSQDEEEIKNQEKSIAAKEKLLKD